MSTPGRRAVVGWLVALGAFLALDSCWLTFTASRLYAPRIGNLMAAEVDWRAAALFYPVYLGGLTAFCVLPALRLPGHRFAAARGAAFGFVSYATYDLTNQATLQGWSWVVTAADLAWGSCASAAAAWCAVRVLLALDRREQRAPPAGRSGA